MRRIIVSLSLLAMAGCGSENDSDFDVVDADDSAEEISALDAESILAFLNGPTATYEMLTETVRLQARAATNITAHVRGPDGALQTRDDDLLQSIAELDAIYGVGPATIAAIEAYVRVSTQRPTLTIEGVDLTVELASLMVTLANTASESVLDNDVGLDARAATAIVEARPIANIESLASVSYVGTTALTRMRDYVRQHPTPPPAPPAPPPAPPAPPAPPVHTSGATIIAAATPDATHVVITYSRPMDESTPGSSFSIFMSEPDNGLSSSLVSIVGAVITLETEPQEPGVDYTFEAAASVKDAQGIPVDMEGDVADGSGRWVHFDGFSSPCTSLIGGTFDGVEFQAGQECQAVEFLNFARFSEMGGLSVAGRHTAYDCGPFGICGFRSSQWRSLSQFADTTGVGPSALEGVKTAIASWTRNGLPYDTVAQVWATRSTLLDKPINFDKVYVTRRLADQSGAGVVLGDFKCIEVRDTPTSPNYLSACIQQIRADSAGGCSVQPDTCLDPVVGSYVSLRGTLRRTSSTGGYTLTVAGGPGAANPNVP